MLCELDLWWGMPLLLAVLIGSSAQPQAPADHATAHSSGQPDGALGVAGVALALVFGLVKLGGLISGLIGALLAELNQRFRGRGGCHEPVLAGFTALGVLLVWLLQVRVDPNPCCRA